MRAGRLNRRISLQSNTPTANTHGEPVAAWTTYATVWAAIEPIQGQERYRAQVVTATMSHVVWMRYRAGVLPTHRILHGTRTFDILAVMDDEDRHERLTLHCSESP